MHQVGSVAEVNKIVRASFFKRDPLTCARELIGTELIWDDCSGIVVEVEAYAAINDEAAHTFTRPSARSFIERNEAGAAYVYFNYGMHWMLNVLVKGDENGFVLIRALEPRKGIGKMKKRRGLDDVKRLCSGPGKLTQALGEQTVGEPRHRRHQFVKALRPTQHHADDRAAPTSPDQFHRVVKTRTDFRFSFASVPFRGRCRPFSRALNSTCLFLHG